MDRSTTLVTSCLAVLLSGAGMAREAAAQQQERYIRMVDLLDRGEAVFGVGVSRTPDGAADAVDDPRIDFIWYDMEHSAFDPTLLRTFLQFTLDRAEIRSRPRPGTDHPVLVRIPVNGREVAMNQWLIKNVLDQGVHGIIAPFIEDAEQARNLIAAMRFPQPPGAAVPEPVGQRGASGGSPALRFWGIPRQEYVDRADLWRLTPRGEMMTMLLIENEVGVENIREIVRVPGVSMVMAATGDLGFYFGGDEERLEEAVQTILSACLEFDVPCAIPAGPDDIERRLDEGFRVFLASGEGLDIGRQAAGRVQK